jgi:hypothetical protein
MKKETFIELLKKVYSWAINKGMNNTLVKIIIGVLFGIVSALYFTSCSLHYIDHEKQLDVEILTVEGNKK